MGVGAKFYVKPVQLALQALVAGGTGFSVVKAMFLDQTYVYDPSHAFVSDIVAHEMPGATGYVAGFAGAGRKTVGGVTVTPYVAAPGKVILFADPVTWPGLNFGMAQIGGIALWLPNTSNADSPLLFFDDTHYPQPTTGVDFVHGFNVGGIVEIDLS